MVAPLPDTRERRLGRYTLHGQIASGGMATVHFGRLSGEGGFSRIVAIKCMHQHLADDPEFRAMFLDEARLAARIRHPNVVSTIDVGSSDEGMFLVMEYVAGESLAALVRAASRRGEAIPASIAIRIVIDALYGLHAAHVATDDLGAPLSIVHRDVSPQNILVATDGHARVLDFGIAKAAGRSHTTRDGQLKGKFRYMAPEQLRDSPVSAQTDVYAASVVLWELLTGEQLFPGSNEAAVMARVLEGVIVPPSKIVPSLPRELDALVLRGLARDPEERFASAEEMAEALEASTQTTTARQVGAWLTRIAGDLLERRAAQIARIEGAASTSGLIVAAAPLAPITTTHTLDAPLPEAKTEVWSPSVAVDEKPARARAVIVALVLGALILAGVVGAALLATRDSRPTPVAASATPTSTATATATSTSTSTSTPTSTSTSTSTPTPTATASPTSIATSTSPRPKPAVVAKPNCTPPYYEDPSGIRRVKPQCL